MPEYLAVGDRVRYADMHKSETFDARVVGIEVWAPIIGRFLKLPKGDIGVAWHRLGDNSQGNSVVIFVESLDSPKRSRWGYGGQVLPPLEY
jgi:hypothetical protein